MFLYEGGMSVIVIDLYKFFLNPFLFNFSHCSYGNITAVTEIK